MTGRPGHPISDIKVGGPDEVQPKTAAPEWIERQAHDLHTYIRFAARFNRAPADGLMDWHRATLLAGDPHGSAAVGHNRAGSPIESAALGSVADFFAKSSRGPGISQAIPVPIPPDPPACWIVP